MTRGMAESEITNWQRYRESIYTTLLRNGAIAVIIGAALSSARGGVARWPMNTLLALWPALGGHWVELWFLNWLRPRISKTPMVQVLARLGTWFAGGVVLYLGMYMTATALLGFKPVRWPASWIGGLAFIGLELVVHLVLWVRGRRSFYNGRG